ncbi:hypothetical protein JOM56_009188 [Amanita muscaria]
MAPATFRPNKPLPKDSPQLHYQRPFLWILLEFTISCLCLGIPFHRLVLGSQVEECAIARMLVLGHAAVSWGVLQIPGRQL